MSKSSQAHKIAEEFINVLKYNLDLTHEQKVLSLEMRLNTLITDVEQGCQEAHQRQEENKVIIDNRPEDIQPLSDLMLKDQVRRGVLLN